MSQKTALITSATITAFLLIIMGDVLTSVALGNAAPPPVDTSTSVANPADVQALQQRDQQYQQLLAEANRRLQEAYAQMTATASATTSASAPTSFVITPDEAAVIALNAAPGSTLQKLPELVQLQGSAAYEVSLDTGLVYVDANSGQVLFNSAIPQSLLGNQQREEHESGEHSILGDDDD